MPQFSYKTIEFEAEGLYKEKGSKFLSFAFPVADEGEVRAKLELLRKKYFDARHHCYAYRLGADGQNFRANDDGEPNHSAGDPILGQLRSKDLTSVLVVIVRYFGGVKLGVGGLIAAYRAAAEDVLNNSKIIEREISTRVALKFDYASIAEVMRLVNDFSMTIIRQNFVADCEIELEYPVKYQAEMDERLSLLISMGKIIRLE